MYSRLIYFYSLELLFRLIYIFVSFIFCLSVASLNSHYLLFFEFYPFVQLGQRKFIATNVMDLFNTLWLLIIFKSLFFVFPYWLFHLYKFNSSSWYFYQLKFFKQFFLLFICFFFVSFLIFYFIFLPCILFLFTKLDVGHINLFEIFMEFRILSYVKWVLTFQYFISTFNLILFLVIFHFYFFVKLNSIYFVIKYYRKFFIFIILFILFLLMPSDGFMQGFLVGFIFLIFEAVFLFVCYKLCYKNKF
uniref:Sec-independent protein translocase component TatC n=1 Tax=Hydropuntia rangiferina TaxID=338881 RepID=A0A345UBA3_9FLOR|nr:Sec-independent protein translocase component TatC [Hydropuntia rangiferina]AXI97739.1 Sec-independent protein translocase component TatC [Hydropuntia rangiferina]UAD89765.1 Sec-independent protein translocase component TatC [Hydropuntia rangiferina]